MPTLDTAARNRFSSEVGTRLCELLGISPDNIRGVDIHCHVGEPVTVRVERFVTTGEMGALETLVERYKVVLLSAERVPAAPSEDAD